MSIAQSTSELDFLSNILTPGSSLHPKFLLILDGAFALLLFVLFGLAVLTRGNIHTLALIVIAGCLWVSVKWFVSELQETQMQPSALNYTEPSSEDKGPKCVKDE